MLALPTTWYRTCPDRLWKSRTVLLPLAVGVKPSLGSSAAWKISPPVDCGVTVIVLDADEDVADAPVGVGVFSPVISSMHARIVVTWVLPVTVIAPVPWFAAVQYQILTSGWNALTWNCASRVQVPPVAHAIPVIVAATPPPSVPADTVMTYPEVATGVNDENDPDVAETLIADTGCPTAVTATRPS